MLVIVRFRLVVVVVFCIFSEVNRKTWLGRLQRHRTGEGQGAVRGAGVPRGARARGGRGRGDPRVMKSKSRAGRTDVDAGDDRVKTASAISTLDAAARESG